MSDSVSQEEPQQMTVADNIEGDVGAILRGITGSSEFKHTDTIETLTTSSSSEFAHADAGSNLNANPISTSATELRVRLTPLYPDDIFTDDIDQGPLGY